MHSDLRRAGISIDLIKVYPKVRAGGWIGGDDFTHTVWQHGARFEPTLVFPFAVYFAEAVGARIFGLPHLQFLICKPPETGTGFEFRDLTESYLDTNLQGQFRLLRVLRRWSPIRSRPDPGQETAGQREGRAQEDPVAVARAFDLARLGAVDNAGEARVAEPGWRLQCGSDLTGFATE